MVNNYFDSILAQFRFGLAEPVEDQHPGQNFHIVRRGRNRLRRGGCLPADLHQTLNHGIQLTIDLVQPPQCGDGMLFGLAGTPASEVLEIRR